MERSIIVRFKFPVVNVYTYFSGQAAPGVIWGLIKVKEKKVSAGLPIILMGLSVPLDPLRALRRSSSLWYCGFQSQVSWV